MTALATIPPKAALADLQSKTCACGAPKAARMTFCRIHYFSLPVGIREALYEPIGDGYEAAYASALGHLRLESPALKTSAPPTQPR